MRWLARYAFTYILFLNVGRKSDDNFEEQVYLEATENGKLVHERLGFVVDEYYAILLPARWAGKTPTQTYLMRRPIAIRIAS